MPSDRSLSLVHSRTEPAYPVAADLLLHPARLVCVGEALRAGSVHCPFGVFARPDAVTLEFLESAFEHFAAVRAAPAPADFTLYVFALLLECCHDAAEERALRLGARRYAAERAGELSGDILAVTTQAAPVPEEKPEFDTVSGGQQANHRRRPAPGTTRWPKEPDLVAVRSSGQRLRRENSRSARRRQRRISLLGFLLVLMVAGVLIPIFG